MPPSRSTPGDDDTYSHRRESDERRLNQEAYLVATEAMLKRVLVDNGGLATQHLLLEVTNGIREEYRAGHLRVRETLDAIQDKSEVHGGQLQRIEVGLAELRAGYTEFRQHTTPMPVQVHQPPRANWGVVAFLVLKGAFTAALRLIVGKSS